MDNVTTDHLANNVRTWRNLLGWSQYMLSRKSGVARSVVVRIEKGGHAATLSTIQRLAAALGAEPDKLLAAPKPRRGGAAA